MKPFATVGGARAATRHGYKALLGCRGGGGERERERERSYTHQNDVVLLLGKNKLNWLNYLVRLVRTVPF